MSNAGRADLERWRQRRGSHFFQPLGDLETALELRTGGPVAPELVERLRTFADALATVIEPCVVTIEGAREFPRLRSFDEVGNHVDQIEFHPDAYLAADATWGSGLLSAPLDFHGAFETASLFYLLAHVGEGGLACPAVCTMGLRRALEHRASAALGERYLPGLTATNAERALRGSQFLTEVQGGSDVGANETVARPDPEVPGAYRLTGEKWFCSVADADLFAMTARPEGAPAGTAGLACFLVPRTLDGQTPNGFRLRRLKDKLGTRALASAEIDFDGALGYPIGELADGFAIAVEELLNTSRWLNAVGSSALMSRAWLEASSFATERRAFQRKIVDFPAVREQLAIMKSEAAAALASTMALTELVGRLDAGVATDDEVAVHRFLVNANKYVTSIAASDVIHRGIEVLGGNGTIEDFSPLPRLYRDAVVFESWEGTHNVLCAQVLRDCGRRNLLDAVERWIRKELDAAGDTAPARLASAALDGLRPELDRALGDPDFASRQFRFLLEQLMAVLQGACLLRQATVKDSDPTSGSVADFFLTRKLGGEHRVEDRESWTSHVDEVLGYTASERSTSGEQPRNKVE